jgi:hypothetical protein
MTRMSTGTHNAPRAALLAAAAMLGAWPAAAIESQALGRVEPLPAEIRQAFSCGEWSSGGAGGHYRIVVVEVSGGAGTEVYIQRVQEADGGSDRHLRVLETTPVRELNDDHAQYAVSAARCIGAGAQSSVELLATFEHDPRDVQHRIRISLASPGAYRARDTVLRPRRTR